MLYKALYAKNKDAMMTEQFVLNWHREVGGGLPPLCHKNAILLAAYVEQNNFDQIFPCLNSWKV